MSLPLALAVYFVAWWTVLFAVLPIGVRAQGENAPAGTDPGAPASPRLLMKAGITTLVAAAVTGVVEVIARMD